MFIEFTALYKILENADAFFNLIRLDYSFKNEEKQTVNVQISDGIEP